MAKLMRAMSDYPVTDHWHFLGDDSKTVQYVFTWELGKDLVKLKRLKHYGNGGVNSGTGESWGDPSVWEILPSWEFSGLNSMYKRDKEAARKYVEGFVFRYLKEDLGVSEWTEI